jgi:hypothetical protein
MIIRCSCCSKQIIPGQAYSDRLTTNGITVTFMGPTLGYCCGICSKDLDEYGLFPEERIDL